jgi:hypothetical protein
MIQLTTYSANYPFGQPNILETDMFFGFLMILSGIAIIICILYIIRAIFRSASRTTEAFKHIVLQVAVPKERKSEGQGGQVSQDDRLEQIKEEIGMTETFFASIAGLRAHRGFYNWLRGRTDNFSFEIVMHNQLIYFYIAIPRKMREFIEQQLHAQFPYAQIEEILDYNIFGENSAIVGAYLTSLQTHSLPFKTYKSMESDPMSAILNSLAKVREPNDSAAIQFVIRSAHRKWRRKGIKIVREIRKGRKFEKVINKTWFTKMANYIGLFLDHVFKKPDDPQKPREQYQLSPMEEEMMKGIEEKLSKAGADVTIRVLSVSDDETRAQMNLDNILNSFSQLNLYRFGNSFKASVPKNQSLLIRDFIYRAFSENKKVLLNTEEISSIWHLPLHSTETPHIKWLTGRSAPPPSNMPTEGLLLGFAEYRGIRQDIYLKEADRRRHLYIIGKSGTGKSVTIANMAIQDIVEGKGVGIVDPHGDLVESVLEHIPKERADDVIIFSPSDLERQRLRHQAAHAHQPLHRPAAGQRPGGGVCRDHQRERHHPEVDRWRLGPPASTLRHEPPGPLERLALRPLHQRCRHAGRLEGR